VRVGRQGGRQAERDLLSLYTFLVVLVVVLVVEQGRVCAGATSTPWHLEALVQIIQEALSTPQTAQQRIHRGAAAQECAHILCVQLACLILQPGEEDTTCRYRTHACAGCVQQLQSSGSGGGGGGGGHHQAVQVRFLGGF
jgi:hypothetical protein